MEISIHWNPKANLEMAVSSSNIDPPVGVVPPSPGLPEPAVSLLRRLSCLLHVSGTEQPR